MSDLTAVSLFAGIGGFDLALKRAGVAVKAAVEIDPACRGVLARRFPQTTLFSDVKEVTGDQLRAAGLVPGRGVITAGWPCQGNSVAGRGKGMADPRSGLWRHVVRLLDEARPRWFIGENVPGLLSVNGGRDFGAVLGDLDDLGYGVAWRVLDAQWFGVPQRRRRVFLAGCLGDPAGPVEVLLEPEGGGGHPAEGGEAGPGTPGRAQDRPGIARVIGTLGGNGPGGGWRVGADEAAAGQLVASTLQGGGRRGHRLDAESAAGGHLVAIPLDLRNAARSTEAGETAGTGIGAEGDPAFTLSAANRALPGVAFGVSENQRGEVLETTYSRQLTTGGGKPGQGYGAVRQDTAVRRLTPMECERLMGFPDDWTRWLADGTEQSDSARYRQCGNSIAVPVAEWITRRLVAVDGAAAAEGAA
jgi:DNA (cytosine-5)-methyltransferase 1